MVGLYALGTFGAFFFAWLFNKGVMRGVSSPMILEMPDYKTPALNATHGKKLQAKCTTSFVPVKSVTQKPSSKTSHSSSQRKTDDRYCP